MADKTTTLRKAIDQVELVFVTVPVEGAVFYVKISKATARREFLGQCLVLDDELDWHLETDADYGRGRLYIGNA